MYNNYEIKQLSFDTNDDFNKLVDLQNLVYKGRHLFSVTSFEHLYKRNPLGTVVSFNAFYGDELVAHYACIPYKMCLEGKEYLGLLDIATVTHPEHRGKGLFKRLAATTFEYAKKDGFKFVLGVANANSFPGYMKYFPFNYIGQLDVRIGVGSNILSNVKRENFVVWDNDALQWRLKCFSGRYYASKKMIYGKKNVPFVKLIMSNKYDGVILPKPSILRVINLYVGLGADLKKGCYLKVPKFIKHSPFNLIFLDLTEGTLPKVTKDNIFFQLIDFDVA